MKKLLLFFAIALYTTCFSQNRQSDTARVRFSMSEQALAWNRADVEGFMAYYWHSDSLRFIGSKGITHGWQQTLDNYKKGYPTAEAMGQLTFDIKSIEQLSANSIFVVGGWKLKKKDKDVGGYYTLLWRKIKGQWLIVVDHTS